MSSTAAAESVDSYIAAAPPEVQPQLRGLRAAIKRGAPDAEERISYGMPAYHLNGRLAYFALQSKHIGVYAFTSTDVAGTALAQYSGEKSTLRLPFDQPLPLDAIAEVVRRRAEAARR
jgi:uncharacterized protein YdhG (YjbR/CyaY superfamily)